MSQTHHNPSLWLRASLRVVQQKVQENSSTAFKNTAQDCNLVSASPAKLLMLSRIPIPPLPVSKTSQISNDDLLTPRAFGNMSSGKPPSSPHPPSRSPTTVLSIYLQGQRTLSQVALDYWKFALSCSQSVFSSYSLPPHLTSRLSLVHIRHFSNLSPPSIRDRRSLRLDPSPFSHWRMQRRCCCEMALEIGVQFRTTLQHSRLLELWSKPRIEIALFIVAAFLDRAVHSK